MWVIPAPGLSLTVTPPWGLKDAKTDPCGPQHPPSSAVWSQALWDTLDVTEAVPA